MKQFTQLKVLTFSALSFANFLAFAMEDNKSINEKLLQDIKNYYTSDGIAKINDLLDQGGNPIGVIDNCCTPLGNALELKGKDKPLYPVLINLLLGKVKFNDMESKGIKITLNRAIISTNLKKSFSVINLFRENNFIFKDKGLIPYGIFYHNFSIEMAKKLIEYGAGVEEGYRKWNNTAMHELARRGISGYSSDIEDSLSKTRSFRDLLLEHGGTNLLNAKNKRNEKPYDIASDQTDYYGRQPKKFSDIFDPEKIKIIN